MVFVFGTTERARPRGWVVDRCPSCLDLSWFELVDHHQAFHAYFVPLGRGRYMFTSQRCGRCNSQFPIERDDFVTTLDDRDRRELGVMEGLRKTNPPLARRFDEIDELERDNRSPYRDSNDESGHALLDRALEQLRELERRGVDSSRYLGRFRNWSRLSSGERELLCAELRGFHDATTG